MDGLLRGRALLVPAAEVGLPPLGLDQARVGVDTVHTRRPRLPVEAQLEGVIQVLVVEARRIGRRPYPSRASS